MAQQNKVVKKRIIPNKNYSEEESFIFFSTENEIKPKLKCKNKSDRFRNSSLLSSTRRKMNKNKKHKINLDMERGF